MLLNRDLKRNGPLLATVAVFIMLIRFADVYWLIGPVHGSGVMTLHWLDVAAPVGLGGVFFALFLWQLGSRPMVPIGEPMLAEAIVHGRDH